MADRYGSRTVFRSAIAVFVIGSLACGFSSSLPTFVASRFLQGMGGAMMVPVGRLVLLKSVEKRELVAVLSFLTMPALFGPILGPPLGGLISTYFQLARDLLHQPADRSRRLGFTSRAATCPRSSRTRARRSTSSAFVLSGVGLSALTLGAASFGQHLLPTIASIACVAAGVVLVTAYVLHARRCEREGRAPVLDFRFLRTPTYFVGVVGGSLFRIGVGATPFLLPLDAATRVRLQRVAVGTADVFVGPRPRCS